MDKKKAAGSSREKLYDLIAHYIRHKDEESGLAIRAHLKKTTHNTFLYLAGKGHKYGLLSDFALRDDAVESASNACFIAVTEEHFLERFSAWKQKERSGEMHSMKEPDEEHLFQRYLGNLAARTIYRLSRDEYTFDLFSRGTTIEHLEEMKQQVTDSPRPVSPRRHGSISVVSVAEPEEADLPLRVLDERNSFLMQAFSMIENPRHRDVLYLYDLKGIPLKEIASSKKENYDTVKQWHRRGLTALRNNLNRIFAGKWGQCYFRALEEIRRNYGSLQEPYRLRLRLLEMNLRGLSTRESLQQLIGEGVFPAPDGMSLPRKKYSEALESLKHFPFMDERLLLDEHFRDSMNDELTRSRQERERVLYVFLQTVEFHLQQVLWTFFQTCSEMVEMSPREGESTESRKQVIDSRGGDTWRNLTSTHS